MSQSDAGDPYASQCQETARRVAHALGLTKDQWSVAFQSKFGPAAWLTPATIDQMRAFPTAGKKDLSGHLPRVLGRLPGDHRRD